MTSKPRLTLVAAALVGAVIVSGADGTGRIHEAAAPGVPFWQLQGAGMSVARESDAIERLRSAAREAETFRMAAERR